MLKRIFSSALFALVLTACSSPVTVRQSPEPATVKFELAQARYGHAMATDGRSIYVFGGSGKKGFLNTIEALHPGKQAHDIFDQRVATRRYYVAAWDGEHSIYLTGGLGYKNKRAYLDGTLEVYNTLTGEITQAAPSPFPTRMGTATFVNGKLYVFGGEGVNPRNKKLTTTRAVIVYDKATNSWTPITSMPISALTYAVTDGESIYIVGGYDGKKQLSAFYRFNPAKNSWTPMPDLPTPTSAHSAVIWQNYLLVFGDYNELDRTLAFDFTTKKWARINLGYQPARHAKAAVVGNDVFVVGGTTAPAKAQLNKVQHFTANEIHAALSLPQNKSHQ